MTHMANLKAEMARRGLSQKELAQRIGATEAAVSRWLSGERQPSLRYALAIHRQFPDCPMSYLFSDWNA